MVNVRIEYRLGSVFFFLGELKFEILLVVSGFTVFCWDRWCFFWFINLGVVNDKESIMFFRWDVFRLCVFVSFVFR